MGGCFFPVLCCFSERRLLEEYCRDRALPMLFFNVYEYPLPTWKTGDAAYDQRLSLSCSESTDLAAVLGFNFTDVLAPAEGLPPSTAHITQFVHGIRILLFARVGVYCRFVNGTASATRAPCGQTEPLATLYLYLARS